jgi:pimeloyl-ACP methyl ester carboxylesterase
MPHAHTRSIVFAILCLPGFCRAQDFSPPPPFPPSATVLKDIAAKTEQLGAAIAELRKQGLRDPDLADVAIYHRAARMIVAHNEFFTKSSGADTVFVLEQGLERAKELAQGHMPWTAASGTTTLRGYASRVDGSPQPYAVTLPADYGKDANKRWRVDVVLHGRNQTLTEVGFIRTHGDKPAPGGLNYARIDVFGRGNNAYRWAGETDVFEAIDSFFADERAAGRERLPDPARVVLRGFSMGGAGTWHLGLHYPDRWCVIGPGAGFTTTHGYAAKLPKPLPPHQEACLRIYDAVDYAENALNVPIVAYSGALDKQKAAADNIERLLGKHNLSMTHLIAPDLEHKFPPEWQAKADAHWSKHAARGLTEYPPRVRFVTYTMKYPGCTWAEILGMQRHYEKASIDATRDENGFAVATQNVRVMHLLLPKGAVQPQQVRIDGQELVAKPWTLGGDRGHLYLERRGDAWHSVLPQRLVTLRQQRPQKITGLQGPIDDAFTDGFLCVRGTGRPWHDATQRYAEANLKRFEAEWSKYLRGDLPVKDDVDVTNEDIATKNLILFGDPASNALIAQVADRLPLRWDREKIVLAGKEASSAEHVPVLIHPSPLNASRYVVLNSGHTFHAPEFRGTNALLFPRLGDYALLRLNPTAKDALGVDVVHAGLFDEYWSINR